MGFKNKIVRKIRFASAERHVIGDRFFFLGPAILLFGALSLYPLLMTFYNSMHILRMDMGMKSSWVGLQHYVELLSQDDIFRMSVRNSLIWAVSAPFWEIPVSYIMALYLNRRISGWRTFRVFWFTPMLFSFVVTAVIFRWIFNYEWGAVNVFLRLFGLDSMAVDWLGRTDTALPSLIFVQGWKYLGFNMVIFLAALQSIPSNLIEAAKLDGATNAKTQWHVVVPLMRATIVNLVILCFIGKMRQFELVWLMTNGGPMHYTETVATYVYKRAFNWRTLDLGYPSAIAVFWFIIILLLTVTLRNILSSKEQLEY